MNKTKLLSLVVLGLAGSLGSAQAQTFVNYSAVTGGTTADHRWTNFTLPPGVSSGTSGTAGQWAGTTTATNNGIAADGGSATNLFYVPLTGTGTALNPSETTDFAGGGVYTFFSQTDFTVSSTTPLSGLKTLVFQLNLATGLTGAFGGSPADYSATGTPKLTLQISGGGSYVAQAATYSLLEDSSTTFVAAIGTNTDVHTWGYQWDLSAVSGTITGYTINFESAYHTVIQGADVTQSTSILGSNVLTTVPEPSTYMLMALGLGAIFYLHRRQTGHHQPTRAEI